MYLRQKTTYHRKNQESFIAFAFTRLQCFTVLWNGSPMLILNVHRNYSFKATIFIRVAIKEETMCYQVHHTQ